MLRARLRPLALRAGSIASRLKFALARRPGQILRLNLGAGSQRVEGWISLDLAFGVDLLLDLSRASLPFADGEVEAVACISAINYLSRERAAALVREVRRVLRKGGVARFAVQDLRALAERYVRRDLAFFDQRKEDGSQRFEGSTPGGKFAAWFYGYPTAGGPCRSAWDFESLAQLFEGFSVVEERRFQESRLADASRLDNRPDQMFFLEAVK